MKKLMLALFAFMLTSSGFAAVDVQKASDFPSAISSLAIAPLPCSEGVNCVKIEKHLNKSVAKHFPAKVVGTDQIKQTLLDMSVVEPDKEAVLEAAKKLEGEAA